MNNQAPQKKFTPVRRSEFEQVKAIIYGFLIVAGLAVVSLVVQYTSATQATFQDLKDQVVSQNAKIDTLTKLLEISREIKTP